MRPNLGRLPCACSAVDQTARVAEPRRSTVNASRPQASGGAGDGGIGERGYSSLACFARSDPENSSHAPE